MKKLIALSFLSLSLYLSNGQSVQGTGSDKMMKTQQAAEIKTAKPARIKAQPVATAPTNTSKVSLTNSTRTQSTYKTSSTQNKRLVTGTSANTVGDNHPKLSSKKAKQQQAAKMEWINQQKQQGKTDAGLRPVTGNTIPASGAKK